MFGTHLQESRLQGQPYYKTCRREAGGRLPQAETLTWSAHQKRQATEQETSTCAPDVTLFGPVSDDPVEMALLCTMSTTARELRAMCRVSHMWPRAPVRQPKRAPCSDPSKGTLSDFLAALFSNTIFFLQREIAEVRTVVPQWAHCLRPRKEAVRLTRARPTVSEGTVVQTSG